MTLDLVRRFFATAGTAALTASAALLLPLVAPTAVGGLGVAAAEGCPDIEVVFARGTNEGPGLGLPGGAFVDSLRGKVGGRSVGAYAVDYPASYDFLAAANGANDMSAHVQYMMGACPNTRLVLGGYSQGAAVTDIVAAVPFPAFGFTNPLPPNAPDFVAALVAFGNPSTKLGQPLTNSPVWGGRSIDLCNGGDPVCSDGDNVAAHRAYAGGSANSAANFAAGLL